MSTLQLQHGSDANGAQQIQQTSKFWRRILVLTELVVEMVEVMVVVVVVGVGGGGNSGGGGDGRCCCWC